MPSGSSPAEQAQLLGHRDVALFRRQDGAERRVQAAADRDVEDEQRRHHQPRHHARQPELADRLARDHRVEHQHHRRRHQDAERRPGLDHARDHPLVVAAFQQFGQRDGGPDGHARHRQPVHGRDQHHQPDGADGKPAVHRPIQTWNMR
jgi:hypothetical protein